MSLGPFDLTGGPFLILYFILLACAFLAGLIIPWRMRPDGRRQAVDDVDQLAFLAGGATRFSDSVVARMLAARSLALTGTRRFRAVARGAPASPAEASILAIPAPIRWKEIVAALQDQIEPIRRRLISAGLMMTAEERSNIRFWSILPYLMLIAFGATKWAIGDMRDRPVGYLTGLLVLTAAFAIIRWLTVDPRTRAGLEELADAKEREARLRLAPTAPEVSLAVALFGTTVLAGSGWEDFHKLRSTGGDGGAAGGCSSDGGGGSGCGGGGCGG